MFAPAVSRALPKFLSLGDFSGGEERNVGKSEILMVREHLDGHQVRGARVVDEAGDVAVLVGVQAIRLSVLRRGERKCT